MKIVKDDCNIWMRTLNGQLTGTKTTDTGTQDQANYGILFLKGTLLFPCMGGQLFFLSPLPSVSF